MKYLGRDLRRRFENYAGILLVAHPLLVQLLGDICRVWYIHGEIAWPVEFDLLKAEKMFVPLEITQDRMLAAGLMKGQFEITGLVLEPEIVDRENDMKTERKRRIERGDQPTFAFYTSGAYPKAHLKQTITGIKYILSNKSGRVCLSAGIDRRMAVWLQKQLSEFDMTSDVEQFRSKRSDFLILHLPERENLTLLELELLPDVDTLTMAAHERINWSVGLGFPTMLLWPMYGSFAPLNYEFVREQALIYDNPEHDIRISIDNFVRDFRARSPKLISEKSKFPLEGASRISDIILKSLK
jgi:hypothetical protein